MTQAKLDLVIVTSVALLMVLFTTVAINAMLVLDGSNLVLTAIK